MSLEKSFFERLSQSPTVRGVAAAAGLALATEACTATVTTNKKPGTLIAGANASENKDGKEDIGAITRDRVNDMLMAGNEKLKNLDPTKKCEVKSANPVSPLEAADPQTGVPKGGIVQRVVIGCDTPVLQKTIVTATCKNPVTRVVGEQITWKDCKDPEGVKVNLEVKGGISSPMEIPEIETEKGKAKDSKSAIATLTAMRNGTIDSTGATWIGKMRDKAVEQVDLQIKANTDKSAGQCRVARHSDLGVVNYDKGEGLVHKDTIEASCAAVVGRVDIYRDCTDYDAEGEDTRFTKCNATSTKAEGPKGAEVKLTSSTGFELEQSLYSPDENKTPSTSKEKKTAPTPKSAPASSASAAPAASSAPAGKAPAAPASKDKMGSIDTECTVTYEKKGDKKFITGDCKKLSDEETAVSTSEADSKSYTIVIKGNTDDKTYVCMPFDVPKQKKDGANKQVLGTKTIQCNVQ